MHLVEKYSYSVDNPGSHSMISINSQWIDHGMPSLTFSFLSKFEKFRSKVHIRLFGCDFIISNKLKLVVASGHDCRR